MRWKTIVLGNSCLGLHRAHELRNDALDFFPLHDMTTGVYCAIRLDAVNDIMPEMDGVTVANVLLARLAHVLNEGQTSPSVRYREACAQ